MSCSWTKTLIQMAHCMTPVFAVVFFFYFITKAPELSFPAALVVSSFVVSTSISKRKTCGNYKSSEGCKDSQGCK
jgi:hypothetical protein